MFAVDFNVLADLRSGGRKFPFMLNPVKGSDLEKLKLKPDIRIIEIKELTIFHQEIWRIGEGEKGL